jgi:threonine synthase
MKTLQTSRLTTLACSACHQLYSAEHLSSYSSCCNQPLVVEYDLNSFSKIDLEGRVGSMWRYFEVLPVQDPKNIVSLGEGMTSVHHLPRLSNELNVSVFVKDESTNPTGSFKARGMSAAVSKARELGIDRLIVPTAGNAGGALAAYAAKANMKCIVVMPEHTPEIFKQECQVFGARLILVKGFINDCARKVEEIRKEEDYFDVSTLKEPYRLEGKKTMGYEIAEQFNWKLPDVIVYPAGGGTGLIGIWKAFQEMIGLGWIQGPLPRMVAVQAKNCAPVEAAMKNPTNWKENFSASASVAGGLVVPYPFGMNLMLQVIRESHGEVTVADETEIIDGIKAVAKAEGMLLSPEGSAALKGLQRLVQEKKIGEGEQVLFLNTASGYKYMDSLK